MPQLFPTVFPTAVNVDGAALLHVWQEVLPAADTIFQRLLLETPWQQPTLTLYGRTNPLPRLQSWHGDAAYRYSGKIFQPEPWTPTLQQLREIAETLTQHSYNSVLLNLYRHGKDHLGWHADNEPELGNTPWIASLSLGAERDFCLRQRGQRQQRFCLPLPHNSLVLMTPLVQQQWQHAIPVRQRVTLPRINLTFRHIQSA